MARKAGVSQGHVCAWRSSIVGVLGVAVLIIGWALYWMWPDYATDFWPVFAVPAFTLLLFQWIALGSCRRKRTFFLVTDYVYYLVVGVVIGVVAQYVIEVGPSEFKSEQERYRVGDHRRQVEARLTSARARQTELEKRTFDMAAVRACVGANTAGRTRTNLLDPAGEECEAFFEKRYLPVQIRALEEEHQGVLDQEKRLSAAKPAEGENTYRKLLKYIGVPTALLFGVTIKLGQTTANLYASAQGVADTARRDLPAGG